MVHSFLAWPLLRGKAGVALVPRLYCQGDGLVEGKAFTLNDYAGTGRRCPGWGAPENFDQEDGVFRFRIC